MDIPTSLSSIKVVNTIKSKVKYYFQKLKPIIQDLLRKGVIIPTNSPFNSPVKIVV